MARAEVVVLIPESTRKHAGGSADGPGEDAIAVALPDAARRKLEKLREEVLQKSPARSVDAGRFLPAHDRFDGNMYRHIPRDAWERRSPAVEIVIASGLRGLVASRDLIPAYRHSMAELLPPFGKLNRWWHAAGLPDILAEYLLAVRPKTVVDLLSLEYRESVAGYDCRLRGMNVKKIDFPGMGRASQPRRGEKVAEILETGEA
ncbi:MAG: peroxide stress protein YaaA [Thermoplasmata archaeon]